MSALDGIVEDEEWQKRVAENHRKLLEGFESWSKPMSALNINRIIHMADKDMEIINLRSEIERLKAENEEAELIISGIALVGEKGCSHATLYNASIDAAMRWMSNRQPPEEK